MRIVEMLVFILALLCGAVYPLSVARSAIFTTEKEWKSGSWAAVLYNNINGNRKFCALEAESINNNTTIRINMYADNKEPFMEIYNSEWNHEHGYKKYTLSFYLKNGMDGKFKETTYDLYLVGRLDLNSFTYEYENIKNFNIILGFINYSTELSLKNENNVEIEKYSMKGSSYAVEKFKNCLNEYVLD